MTHYEIKPWEYREKSCYKIKEINLNPYKLDPLQI